MGTAKKNLTKKSEIISCWIFTAKSIEIYLFMKQEIYLRFKIKKKCRISNAHLINNNWVNLDKLYR